MFQLFALPAIVRFFFLVGTVLSMFRKNMGSFALIWKFSLAATGGTLLAAIVVGLAVKIIQNDAESSLDWLVAVYYLIVPVCGVTFGILFLEKSSSSGH